LHLGYLLERRREGLGERRFSWSQLQLTSFGPPPGFDAAGDVDFRQRHGGCSPQRLSCAEVAHALRIDRGSR
jgi:hypothetical protein